LFGRPDNPLGLGPLAIYLKPIIFLFRSTGQSHKVLAYKRPKITSNPPMGKTNIKSTNRQNHIPLIDLGITHGKTLMFDLSFASYIFYN
jgi:hypothetical protein